MAGAYIVEPEPLSDQRGWFARTYCRSEFEQIGHRKEWVQMNHSYTREKGTIRGLHFQLPPYAEIKLIRCIAGAVFDVIVDVRSHSPGFLQWYGVELSAANKKMMYIPEGFAHGFQTLTDDAELVYCHSAYYMAGRESGIRYDDPVAGITWPLSVTEISDRDENHPLLDSQFTGIQI
jgi:dTDP-4-dehydrorhamnose 3,5-epimerase